MAYRAKFKTAYLQRMLIIEATLAADVKVGDLVVYNPATKALTASAAGDASVANSYIVAQSDTSFAAIGGDRATPYKHINVEDKNLQFDPTVKSSSTVKKVAVFKVVDPTDVEVESYTASEQLA